MERYYDSSFNFYASRLGSMKQVSSKIQGISLPINTVLRFLSLNSFKLVSTSKDAYFYLDISFVLILPAIDIRSAV